MSGPHGNAGSNRSTATDYRRMKSCALGKLRALAGKVGEEGRLFASIFIQQTYLHHLLTQGEFVLNSESISE
jgi:hypothetical protein